MRRWSCGGWLTLSSFGRIFWNFHHGGRWIVPLNVCCGHACSWRGLNLRHYHEWFVSRIIVALRRSKKWCNSLIVELVANSSAYEDDVFFFKSLNVNVLHTLAGTRGLAANVEAVQWCSRRAQWVTLWRSTQTVSLCRSVLEFHRRGRPRSHDLQVNSHRKLGFSIYTLL